ncbi:MAG TPA: DUF6159 family protein [Burkholderiales bacterium]
MKMKRCPKCSNLMPEDVFTCIRCGFSANTGATLAAAGNVIPVKAGRIANGWALAMQSGRVLMLDKSLLVFPLVSGIACFLVLATYAAGIFASGLASPDRHVNEALFWVLLFLYYFANYFIIVFFNSALIACAMIRFRGGDPTVSDGLRAARERLAQIASWALLAATVGVVLRMIEERVGFVGRIITALLGAAWAVATYFVVPVLVVEKLGPVDAAKRSAQIISKAWGEAIVGNVGIGILSFLAVVLLVIPCGAVTLLLATSAQSIAIGVAGGVVTLALLVLIVLASSALNAIILSALYLYAAERKVPQAFEAGRLQAAFVAR